MPTAAFPTPAKRPEYSSLDTSKYRSAFNWEIPHWEDALRRCLRNMNMS
ncbi:MAG TPA: sugar nucleotide-binding protein [Saprospiraceae bacterium]|nr:sugar nucleotide-binding protein [Saprospiraceae bacterium]